MAITKIIKYDGDNSVFVWKHPEEDFNNMTQLIVHESQEAIFMMNGILLDTFGPGKYNLDTESLPILGKMVDNLIYGEASFHAEVYFINHNVQMALKWGTSPKIRFIEPNTGIPLEVGASGNINLKVDDSKKLLIKLVGTTSGIAWDKESSVFSKSLQESFRPLINNVFRTNFAPIVKEENINIIEIDQYVDVLAKPMKEQINKGFEEYGLKVVDFYISDIVLPEEDNNYKRIKQIMADSYLILAERSVELEKEQTTTAKKQMELQREILQAQADADKTKIAGYAEAEVMKAQGVTKKDYIQADVQKAFAEGLGKSGSSGGSSIASDMIQMQMGMMAASNLSGQMKDVMTDLTKDQSIKKGVLYCPNCGAKLPESAKFCMNCGTQILNNKCSKCGNDLPSDAKFCLNCGEKVGE